MTRAMGYTRVSGKGQEDGDGPERQRLAIQRYADANRITIEKWFHDTQTGKDRWEDRAGWSEMMSSVNGVRVILVEKMDRVAREVLISELILSDLKKREITLITASGEDSSDESPERVMLRQMLSVFASYERASICAKLRSARQRRREETGRCEGRKPYGHRPGEAEVIEKMRVMRAAGTSWDAIAAALNKDGVATRGSRKGAGMWYGGTVRRIVGETAKTPVGAPIASEPATGR